MPINYPWAVVRPVSLPHIVCWKLGFMDRLTCFHFSQVIWNKMQPTLTFNLPLQGLAVCKSTSEASFSQCKNLCGSLAAIKHDYLHESWYYIYISNCCKDSGILGVNKKVQSLFLFPDQKIKPAHKQTSTSLSSARKARFQSFELKSFLLVQSCD